MSIDPAPHITQTIILQGDVASADFPVWIERHARKLGVRLWSLDQKRDRLELRASAAREMVDALAIACSLGPKSVRIDMMDIRCDPRGKQL